MFCLKNELFFHEDVIQIDDVYHFIDQLHIALYSFDVEGNTLFANNHLQDMFGYTIEELKEKRLSDLIDQRDVHILKEIINRNISSKEYIGQKYRFKGKGKDHRIILLQLLSYKKHGDSRITIALLDITEIKRNELQLSKMNKELEDVKFALDKANTVSITDIDGNIIYVNDLFCQISKYTREEIIGQNHRIVNSDYHPKEYFQQMWSTIIKGDIWKGEVRNKTKEGAIWWAEATIVPFLDAQRKPYQFVAIRSDITERKTMEEKMYHIEYYDTLTTLPNKKLFEFRSEQEYEQAKRTNSSFSIMILELHGLRFVNNSLGVKIGDDLLKEVALNLNTVIDHKGMLFRVEGHEFAVICSNISTEYSEKLAKEIFHLFEQPFHVDEYELYLTVNIGFCKYPESGENVYHVIQNAYAALEQANEIGTNTFQIFSPNMNIGSYKSFMLKNDLHKACKNNEFFLVYQPRVNPKTHQIIGAEALIRWDHPEWGLVSPEEFIPLAEEDGIINQMGEMVLLYACQQNKKWQDAGLSPIVVSVNFSVYQFLQMNIIEVVENILNRTGLDPKWLEIEITESTIMKDESTVLFRIEKLRQMGVSIAIDDFGTGYSSLSYLQKFKANTIKLDKSFIKEIPTEFTSTEIVSAIIRLCQKLEMRTVAEGVETDEQLQFLKTIHCDEIQGYLYSQPVKVEEFELLLAERTFSLLHGGKETEIPVENRRQFFRVSLQFPLAAQMTITEFAGKHVTLGSTKILIQDIGPGGTRIETNIKLPIRSDLVLKIKTELFGEQLELYGSIVWKKEVDYAYQAYGIRFLLDENQTSHLTYILNQLQVKLRKNAVLPDCSFVTEGKKQFFSLER